MQLTKVNYASPPTAGLHKLDRNPEGLLQLEVYGNYMIFIVLLASRLCSERQNTSLYCWALAVGLGACRGCIPKPKAYIDGSCAVIV